MTAARRVVADSLHRYQILDKYVNIDAYVQAPMAIPSSFSSQGVLQVGTYTATFDELRTSAVLVEGPVDDAIDNWDRPWRARLVDNVQILVCQLWEIGITEVFLDGSFAEAKPHPNDIDGYFECDPVEFARGITQQRLNAIDPYKVWTWSPNSRRPAKGSAKRQLPMWHRYRVELYPHFPGLLLPSGIRDPEGNELPFPKAFRHQRGTGVRKGIIKIVPEGTTMEVR